MRVEFGAGSLGSFLCPVPASCRRVALRVSTAVLSWMSGLALMPLGNLARITSVRWICMVRVRSVGGLFFGEYFFAMCLFQFPRAERDV